MKPSVILVGDATKLLRTLDTESVRCCVTSPPYWNLRSYLPDDHPDKSLEFGLEQTPGEYVARLVALFREVRRVLARDGTLWLNLGDSYAGSGSTGGAGDAVGTDGYARSGRDGRRRAPTPDGLKRKDLVGIPWRVAFALQSDGWYLRSDVIWAKPNPMPESVTDRPTKAHEYVFLLSKSGSPLFWTHPSNPTVRECPQPDYVWRHKETGDEVTAEPNDPDGWKRHNLWRGHDYYYDADAIREAHTMRPQRRPKGHKQRPVPMDGRAPDTFSGSERDELGVDGHPLGRNKRSVWPLSAEAYPGAHFAVMPAKLVEPCILAGSEIGDTVLDPFTGAGTVGLVSLLHGRRFVGCELNPESAVLAEKRIADKASQRLMFTPSGDVSRMPRE